MKGFDSTNVCCIVNCSFLEAKHSAVINLCDLTGTITFWFMLQVLRALTNILSPREQLCAHREICSRAWLFLLILVCFRCGMCSQLDMFFMFKIASWPNANCIGEA
jgi:hypothetical protein